MKRFQRILVGVDLTQGDVLVSDKLTPPAEEAVARAMWLAKHHSAQLTFFHILPPFAEQLDAETQMLLQEFHGHRTVADHATEVVAKLAEAASQEGLVATSLVAHGTSWLEMIQQVLRESHDLVVIGTRHLGRVKSMLVGSTGIKLLRKCPCPVWVTQPQPEHRANSVLVAHDLRPVGDLAMDLGCSMAKLLNAQLHVVHAAESHQFGQIFFKNVSAEQRQSYREEAEQRIQSQLDQAELPLPAKLHFSIESPDVAIMNCIEQYSIDLLVMGTVGRMGISGFITGNTAERLLPGIPCSLLAVKPPEFKSPIALDRV
jgi:universal stress protein E